MKYLLIIFVIIFSPAIAVATGIQVSPPKLELTGEIGKSFTAAITVANPTADVQVFEVYPDEFEEIIKLSPASFVLESGERNTITITVLPKRFPSTRLITTISVVAKPLAASRFQAGAGVKIPLAISVVAKPKSSDFFQEDLIRSIGLLAIACLVLAYLRRFLRCL